MHEYRRLPKRDVWHFHPRCQWWLNATFADGREIQPDAERVFLSYRPTSGELCNECQAKAKKDREN